MSDTNDRDLGKVDFSKFARPSGEDDAASALAELNKHSDPTPPTSDPTPPTEGKGGAGDKDTSDDGYGFLDQSGDDRDEGGEGKAETDDASGDDAASQPTFRETLSGLISKRTGKPVELPENVDEENFVDAVMELGKKTLHPEALRLQAAIEAGMDPREYYQSFSQYDQMMKLPDRELVHRQLKQAYGQSDERPHGLSDEDIESRLDRLEQNGDLKIEAIRLRDGIAKQKQDREQELESYSNQNRGPDPSDPKFKKLFNENLSKVFDEVAGEGFFGIKFADPKHQEGMKKRIGQVLYPSAESRMSEFNEAMSDEKQFLKIAVLWDLARSGRLKVDLAAANAAARRNVADFLTNKTPSSASRSGKGDKVDFSVFSKPIPLGE